jgi:hypothetical protein
MFHPKSSQLPVSRRVWFERGVRYAILLMLGASAAVLGRRAVNPPSGAECLSRSRCTGCEWLNDCPSPALRAKRSVNRD